MMQIDKRFNLVNLEYLEKELDKAALDPLLQHLVESCIEEVHMHRKFNKDYSDYLKFINGRGNKA